jgi:predicted ATPase
MARLDRLAPVREVVQLGATIGRAFTYELIRTVADLDDALLRAELARLVDADILFLRASPSEETYVFKHALIQEAAYESLLRNRRRDYHERIARVFERDFPDLLETRPELLGYHWAGAGAAARAASYYRRAAERANERSALVEAVSQARKGLGLVDGLPADTERARLELELRIVLGAALVATNGFAAPEVAEVYARAEVLCNEVGEPRLLYSALSGLLLFHHSRAELATCLRLCDQRLALAERLGDRALAMQVYENRGTLSFWRSDFEEALVSLERALSLYEPESARALTLVYGTDVAVVSTTYTAHALWMLGYPERAARETERAVARARALAHANSLGLALAFAGALHYVRGDPILTRTFAEEAVAFSTEQQLPFWRAYGTIFCALAMGAEGSAAAGVPIMMEGMAAFSGTGAQIGARFCVSMLADLYRQAGMANDGIALVDSMLPALAESEDRLFDGELHRVRGELLLAASTPDPAAAEASFREALTLAGRQRARSLELRAATSLARVWRAQGRDGEARDVLGAVYGWFTEGFDTADLRAAAALLGELGARVTPPRQAGVSARTST